MKPPADASKPVVYLDGNAVNFLCDEFRGKSKQAFKYFDIPLSWPVIDEIEFNSSYARTVELTDFVWQASHREVFMTVIDLVALELWSALMNKEIRFSSYYDSGRAHLDALNETRKGKTANQTRGALRSAIGKPKQQIRDWERVQRRRWASHFRQNPFLPKDWSQFRCNLQKERYFNQILYGMIATFGLLAPRSSPSTLTEGDLMNEILNNLFI